MIIIPPIINGKSYENADVLVTVSGTPLTTIKAINFSETLADMDGVTATGRDYVSYTNGKLKKTGSLTLLYEEVRLLEKAAPGGKIYDIPLFPITVTMTDDTLATSSYVITAKFKGVDWKSSDGDTAMPIELALFVASIKKVI